MRLSPNTKQMAALDRLIVLFALLSFALFRADFVVIFAYFFSGIYLLLTRRLPLLLHFSLSTAVAFMWMLFAREQYSYNREFLDLWGINLFAFFAWASGLFAINTIFSHWKKALHPYGRGVEFLAFLAFYWSLLIFAETLFYHSFGFHNLGTAQYPGLPICDCLHAPLWMQVSYFLIGPFYFLLCQGAEKLFWTQKNRLSTRS